MPSVQSLPPSAPHRRGWPWTQASDSLPATLPDGRPWPTITVVTPSFNQGRFLEETLRSVLLQGYPSLEYIVMDGGSTDESADILRRYGPWLSHWESEPDRGQAHAINKGIARATGQMFNWINSDDVLEPNALARVATAWAQHPDALLAARLRWIGPSGDELRVSGNLGLTRENFLTYWRSPIELAQPALWVPVAAIREIGPVDEGYRCSFDWEWVLRLASRWSVRYSSDILARFRVHPESKTSTLSRVFEDEVLSITASHVRMHGTPLEQKRLARHAQTVRWWHELEDVGRSQNKLLSVAKIIGGAVARPARLKRRRTWKSLRAGVTALAPPADAPRRNG